MNIQDDLEEFRTELKNYLPRVARVDTSTMTPAQLIYSFRGLSALVAFAATIIWAVVSPAEILYSVTDLGVPAGPYDRTFSRSVTDAGQIAGYSNLSTGAQTLGWRYTPGTGFEPLGLPPNVSFGYAEGHAINNAGQVVGDTSSGGPLRAFRWSEGTGMVLLPTLPGDTNSHAYAINDVGQTAGSSGALFQRVARWSSASSFEDLGLPAGRIVGFGQAINNSGQLAVSAADSLGDSRGYLHTDGSGYRELGSLGGLRVEAWGINDAAQVVGSSALPSNIPNVTHAFVWSEATGMQDLGALPGSNYAQAYAINNLGMIVGESLIMENVRHAFLYRNGMMQDLNSLIDPGQSWTLEIAWDVSDSGLIVGWGTHDGAARSFVLTPVPEPIVLVLAICAICGFAGWRYRRPIHQPCRLTRKSAIH